MGSPSKYKSILTAVCVTVVCESLNSCYRLRVLGKIPLTSMTKNVLLRAVLWKAVVEWLLVTETASQSYKSSYDGYIFTSPGFGAFRKRDDAQTWCTQNGSTLLEIRSSYVQNLTVRFLSDTGIQFADETLLITNGIRNDVSWNWVNGQDINSITITGQEQGLAYSFGYINSNRSRLYITAGVPTDIDMSGYICQGKFDCTNGFLLNEQCYKSYNSPTMSWFDARNRCFNEGGDLASFDFINDDQELNSTLNGSWLSSSATYWIGLRRQWWTWQTSNLEVGFTNWPNGRPVYRPEIRCLCLSKSGVGWEWIGCDCNDTYPFVCLAVQPNTASSSTSTTHVTTTISAIKTTTSSKFISSTATYSNPPTLEPPLSTGIGQGSTDSRALAIGLGIGIPLVFVILALSIATALMKKKLRFYCCYQTRLLANTIGDVDAVTHAQSTMRRTPQMGVNGTLEMVTEQRASPYESLQQEANTINNRLYEELCNSGTREADGLEAADYETVISS